MPNGHWSNYFNTYAEAKASLDLDPDNYTCGECGAQAHVEYGCHNCGDHLERDRNNLTDAEHFHGRDGDRVEVLNGLKIINGIVPSLYGPNTCYRCGESLDAESMGVAEIAAEFGGHIMVHVDCMREGEQVA